MRNLSLEISGSACYARDGWAVITGSVKTVLPSMSAQITQFWICAIRSALYASLCHLRCHDGRTECLRPRAAGVPTTSMRENGPEASDPGFCVGDFRSTQADPLAQISQKQLSRRLKEAHFFA